MSWPTRRQRSRDCGGASPRNRSTHVGPSRSMKNVMKAIVTVATIAVITLLVRDTAVPDKPRSFFAPP